MAGALSAMSVVYAFRLARRELRGGIRGLRVFLACLVLGVTAIAGIGSLAAAVVAGIKTDARDLLGGDAEARLTLRPADAAERAFLADSGQVSEIATMRAMVRKPDGDRRSLIELKAVDPAYPLYGAVALSPAQDLAAALDRREGRFGALVDPTILDRLGVVLGDSIKIGEATLQLRTTIEREPDAAAGGLQFGPRIIIAARALAETGLIRPVPWSPIITGCGCRPRSTPAPGRARAPISDCRLAGPHLRRGPHLRWGG
jgi:putative ABC transport system permease protein